MRSSCLVSVSHIVFDILYCPYSTNESVQLHLRPREGTCYKVEQQSPPPVVYINLADTFLLHARPSSFAELAVLLPPDTMPDTTATNDTAPAGACGLSLHDLTTIKYKEEAAPTDISALASLPGEILETIFGLVADDLDSYISLMQTSRQVNRIAWPFRYRTGNVFLHHQNLCDEESIWPHCADPQSSKGKALEAVLARHDTDLLNKVEVLHLHCDTCMQSSPSNQHVRFPNLRILHTYEPFTTEQYRFSSETAPKLHTVILHSDDALREWHNWCRSDDVLSEADRMIIHWWGTIPKSEASPRTVPQHLWSGATLGSLHIILHSNVEEKVLCGDQPWALDLQGNWGGAYKVYWSLFHGLAEICCSNAQSIVISRTDRISNVLWHDRAYAGQDEPDGGRVDIVQEKIEVAIRSFLGFDGLCKEEINGGNQQSHAQSQIHKFD